MSNGAAKWVYVGTFTRHGPGERGRADGFYACRFDAESGALEVVQEIADVPSPAFLAMSRDGATLYAVNEVPEIDGHSGGAVSAFARDRATGTLEFLNREASHGDDPCHLSVDATGSVVLVSNYTSGSVAMLPLHADGRVLPASDVHQHEGSSVHPTRQQGPHAHSITPDPSGAFALVADLGLDQVKVYRIDAQGGRLIPHDPPFASIHPGAGPRHIAFHPNGTIVYVLGELDSTVTVCRWDAAAGRLEPGQTVSTLPAGATIPNTTAEVRAHPSGRFLYASNRGHDSVAIFAIDAAGGGLTPVGHQATLGRTPRNFALDPTGRWLLAANQESDTVVTFRVDPDTGHPEPTGVSIDLPSPVCVLFAS